MVDKTCARSAITTPEPASEHQPDIAASCRCPFRSCRGEPEGGQRPGGVAGMVAAGGGNLMVTAEFQDADAKVAQGGHDLGAVAGAGLGDVFAKRNVADVVQGLDA